VMELLLGAADVDAECAARYRQQMSEPAGLLGLAQQLQANKSPVWRDSARGELFNPSHGLYAALSGGSVPAVEWLLNAPVSFGLNSPESLVDVVQSGNVSLLRALLDPESVEAVKATSVDWCSCMSEALWTARDLQNMEMIRLLFPNTMWVQQLTVWQVGEAVQCNDPFTRQYMFGHLQPAEENIERSAMLWWQEGFPTLLGACMTGRLELLVDVWGFLTRTFRRNPQLFETFGPRLDRALPLCTEGDLTPAMEVLMHDWIYNDRRSKDPFKSDPIVLAARCGHLPAVRLWLAQGIPAQWALSAAVEHGQREVVSCLIAHGADPLGLSSTDQQKLRSLLRV